MLGNPDYKGEWALTLVEISYKFDRQILFNIQMICGRLKIWNLQDVPLNQVMSTSGTYHIGDIEPYYVLTSQMVPYV